MTTGDGNDTLFGGPGNDKLRAGGGDMIVGGDGGEYVQGGWGDVLSADPMMTPLKVVTLTKVAYSTIYQAVPLPQLVEAKTGGDPFPEQDPYEGMAA